MTGPAPSSSDWPLQRRAKWLRASSVIILVLSLIAIALVYWSHRADQPLPDDFATADNSKIVVRDIERNVGKSGLLLNSISNEFQNPDVVALTIFLSATAIAGICFYLAHLLDRDANSST
jgi:hypothetical protein